QLKGVPKELLERELAQPAERDPEEAAAWALARRKRLGPFGKPELRSDRRQRDLAALVRAGFAFPLVKRVVDGEPP
ncbi:MAG: recombinase RecX, partial [Myxococcales bacterium]